MISATETVHFPILTALVLLPAIGAAVVALIPSRRGDVARTVGAVFALGTLALTAFLIINFQIHPHFAPGGAIALDHSNGFQFVDRVVWLKQWGIAWHLGVDGISLWLVALTALLVPIAIIGATPSEDPKSFVGWMLLLEFGCLGGFLALDLFMFFVMFELVLAPMYFLIVGWGGPGRRPAANKFFLYTMFGSAFMLVAMIVLVVLNAHHTGTTTFDLVALANTPGLARSTGRWLFLGFAIAFAVKTPLVPFHTWLPDTYTEAPTGGSMIVAGVMAKLGAYGFLRYGVYLFPEASQFFGPLLVTLGVVGILYGAVLAAVQKDLKRVVAYSSVAHLGFIALGVFAITRISITGAVIQMVNHGIVIAGLFLLVWFIEKRRGTRLFAGLGGIQKKAPILAALFIFVTFASIGLPGLNGFVGEFLIMIGSFATRRWWAVVAASGVILAAVYLLWAFQQTFHGTPDPETAVEKDLRWSEIGILIPLVAVILFIGLYPKPVLERIDPSARRLERHYQLRTEPRTPETGEVSIRRPGAPTDTKTEVHR
ncbi:MAG: NADH-quinone oxidoreductase subunit M [Actinobacteria bacterium]|nr:NADH-quinone oxidoreductase subunit M [Actinomycetota bacterium]